MVTFHATMTFVNGYKVRLFLSVLRKDFKLKELDIWTSHFFYSSNNWSISSC